VAAECGGRWNLCTAADAGGHRRAVFLLSHGSATHLLLNMNARMDWDTVNSGPKSLRVHRTGTCICHERRSARSTPHIAGEPCLAPDADAHVYFWHIRDSSLVPAADLDPQSGVFNAITVGAVALKVGFLAARLPYGHCGQCGRRWQHVAWNWRVWPFVWQSTAICLPAFRQDSSSAGRLLTSPSLCSRDSGAICSGSEIK